MEANNLEWLKGQAKKLKKQMNITHAAALDLIAKKCGYTSWQHLLTKFNQ